MGGAGAAIYSTDGVDWTSARALHGYNCLNGVATDGNLWVAVGLSGTVLTSTDGADWAMQSGPAHLQPGFPLKTLYGVATGSGLWVAVGRDGFIGTSPDAITWTQQQEAGATGLLDLLAIAIG